MTVVQFTDQFAQQIGEIVTMIYERKKRRVLIAHGLPVDAIHCRRKEKVAHLSPGFEVDLVPLGVAIELHVKAFELELIILAGLLVFGLELVFRQIDDGVVFLDFDQHLLAISADLIAVHLAKDGLFPVFQAVSAKM